MCVCIIGLFMRHTIRIFSGPRYTVLAPVVCLALQNFSTLSHERFFLIKPLLSTKYVFRFPLHIFSETFLILGRIQIDITVHRYNCT